MFGKGDVGVYFLMLRGLVVLVLVIVFVWVVFIVVVYVMIIYGSVVEFWGVNNFLMFKYYVIVFFVCFEDEGICWIGVVWDSFWIIIIIVVIVVFLMVVVGLVIVYLLIW